MWVLGELYGSANETRFALDLPLVVEWIMNNGPSLKLFMMKFSPSRLHTLRTRNSALIKEFMLCLWLTIPKDWLSAKIDPDFFEPIDIHYFLWLVQMASKKMIIIV